MTEIQAIERAKRGDALAFEHLYALHRDFVIGMCRRYVPDEAEDLAQDVFVRAFQHVQQYGGRAAFRSWLGRIAITTCLMRLRKPVLQPAEDELITTGDPTNRLAIEQAFGRIPDADRTALIRRYADGHSTADVAAEVGVSVPAMKSRLRTARARFVEAYG